ncbi:MAG: LysR family transcriptional regulator [Rubrivivax sp.]
MNLRFVEAFYWVVTLRSVTRAAEKLHLTQSAMSSRVAALEQELGTLLLDRRDRQFRVTAAGQRFFGYAEKLLALQSELKAELGAAAAQPMRLRVGAIESVLHSWLLDWVRALRAAQPALALELTVETSPVLLDQLSRGTLDIALAALPAGGGLPSRPLPAMEMVFVGHAQRHRRRRWTLAELATLELLTFQRGSQPQVALADLMQRAGLEPVRLHTVSSISAMAQLVEGGLGVATLPRAVVVRLAERLPLKVLACDTALPPLPIHVSWRDEPASSAQRTLIDSLQGALAGGRGQSLKKSMR